MNNLSFQKRGQEEGIALLITLLLMGVLLSIGASLMNITLKQYQFSGLAFASESAFQAANAGIECVMYLDYRDGNPAPGMQSVFDVPGDGNEQTDIPTVSCMGNVNVQAMNVDSDADRKMVSGEEQRFQFTFGNPNVCTEVSVYKFRDDLNPVPVIVDGINMRKDGDNNGVGDPCPVGGICTVVQSRGYNVSCAEVNAGTNPRIVEREYTQVY